MLKKINVRDLKLGMYLQEICGSWMDHPFWKKSFELTDPKDIKILNECDIHEVWIDTKKGLDIESIVVGLSEEESQKKIDLKLQEAAQSTAKSIPRISVHEELEQARKVHGKAIDLTQSSDSILNAKDPLKWGFDLKKLTGI